MVHIGGRKRRRDGWGEFTLIAESPAARFRCSGASLGYRLASTSTGARRRRSRRSCPVPIIHPIVIDIAICAVMTLAATATMTDYTGKDISGEINHSEIRFTAIVSLR